jgi:hypothetical protein
MRKIVNPQQTQFFDPFDRVLTEQTRKRLLDGWPGVFRHIILQLLPVEAVGAHFDATQGRPTRELYSVAGLLLIKEFMNWTKQQTLDAYSFNINVHYALNLEPIAHDLSMRTLERYIALFEADEIAKTIMSQVTAELVKLLDIKIDKQRLDSTHIFSDMASFGRTRMMGATVKRFLTQVLRHDEKAYNALDESLRQRYTPSIHQLFGDIQKDSDSRRLLRQQVAEDMYRLLKHFADHPDHSAKTTYKDLERIFYEQCDVHENKVTVKAKTGGNVMQNPSDPDATYDGHKGAGYQAQIAETCAPDNEVQLITAALPQTAWEPDAKAVEPVLEALEAAALLPAELLVDTAYAGDANVQYAQEKGVELVGPVPAGSAESKNSNQLNSDDFNVDETTEAVLRCPAGHVPQSSVHDKKTGITKTVMPHAACSRCDYAEQCPVKKTAAGYQLEHTAKGRRLEGRRREQDTDVFAERYKTRGGIESTNSGLKRRVGLGRLRVRGRPAVFHAIYLKLAGWNILRAAACAKMREIVWARAAAAALSLLATVLSIKIAAQTAYQHAKRRILTCSSKIQNGPKLGTAA